MISESTLTGEVQGTLLTPAQTSSVGVVVLTGSSGRVECRARLRVCGKRRRRAGPSVVRRRRPDSLDSRSSAGMRDYLGTASILRTEHVFRPVYEYPAARLPPDEA
jgi:hypothetical protein